MKKVMILLTVAAIYTASGCCGTGGRLCPCCPCNWFARPATACPPAPMYAAPLVSNPCAPACAPTYVPSLVMKLHEAVSSS